jgi:hypothetical protein
MNARPAVDRGRLLVRSVISRGRSMVTGRRALLVCFYALVFPFYWWTAVSSGNVRVRDFYNQFTNSILAGHIDMPYRPPKGLLALKNPYDPALNSTYHRWYQDLILYHGHFYFGWGTTPVFTLFLPWRVLGVGDMPVSLATVIFSCVGLFFAVLLFLTILDRFLPGTSLSKTAVAVTALALCSVVPFILRRPAVYEVEILSGYAFMMLALYLLASGCLRARLIAWRLGLGSLCLGLAFGGRPVLMPVALLAALLTFAVAMRNPANRHVKPVLRYGAIIFAPIGVVLFLALLYNFARFGSPFQYGYSYALGGEDVRSLHLFSFAYMSPSLTYILISPIYFTFSFPFVGFTSGMLPVTVPQGYILETVAGVLVTTPFLVLAGGIPFVGRRDRESREFRAVLFAIAAFGLLAMLLVAYSIWGVTQECEVDYVSLLLIPALLVWCEVTRAKRWRGLILKVAGVAAILYASFVGFAISFTGYYDMLQENNPGTYWTLERATSFIPTAITALEGHPDLVRVYYPSEIGADQPTLTDVRVLSQPLHVDVVSPDSSWRLQLNFGPTLASGRPIDLTLSYGNRTHHLSVSRHSDVVVIPLEGGLVRIRLSVPFGQEAMIARATFVRAK